jgi:hypothetical protein
MKSVLASLLYVVLFATVAHAGNEGGHGGDPVAMEFNAVAVEIARDLQTEEQSNPALFRKWKLSATLFQKAVEQTIVVSRDHEDMRLNENEMDAINSDPKYPNIIRINRIRWYEDALRAKIKLALHEYFGVLNVERDIFPATTDFSDFIDREVRRLESKTANGDFGFNRFYGQCADVPEIASATICVSGDRLKAAETCALSQAQAHCRFADHDQCALVQVTYSPKISRTVMGLRYCEVVAIMK